MARPGWYHAPFHEMKEPGLYMVTAGTFSKIHHFDCDEMLAEMRNRLLSCAEEFGWQLHAWSIFSNHYHFLGLSPAEPGTLSKLVRKLHATTALAVNRSQGMLGRKVWHQYWESKIDFERSYLARLNYIHQNPVRHGLVPIAADYQWCSTRRFYETTSQSFQNTVAAFTRELSIADDF